MFIRSCSLYFTGIPPVCDNNWLVYIVPPAVQFLYLMCPVLVYHYRANSFNIQTIPTGILLADSWPIGWQNRIPVHLADSGFAPRGIRFVDLEHPNSKHLRKPGKLQAHFWILLKMLCTYVPRDIRIGQTAFSIQATPNGLGKRNRCKQMVLSYQNKAFRKSCRSSRIRTMITSVSSAIKKIQ